MGLWNSTNPPLNPSNTTDPWSPFDEKNPENCSSNQVLHCQFTGEVDAVLPMYPEASSSLRSPLYKWHEIQSHEPPNLTQFWWNSHLINLTPKPKQPCSVLQKQNAIVIVNCSVFSVHHQTIIKQTQFFQQHKSNFRYKSPSGLIWGRSRPYLYGHTPYTSKRSYLSKIQTPWEIPK